jgi:hypothetical protein
MTFPAVEARSGGSSPATATFSLFPVRLDFLAPSLCILGCGGGGGGGVRAAAAEVVVCVRTEVVASTVCARQWW